MYDARPMSKGSPLKGRDYYDAQIVSNSFGRTRTRDSADKPVDTEKADEVTADFRAASQTVRDIADTNE